MPQYNGPHEEVHWELLSHVHQHGLSVQGNLARMVANHVALLASLGWITSISTDGLSYGRKWFITAAGLTALQNKELFTPC